MNLDLQSITTMFYYFTLAFVSILRDYLQFLDSIPIAHTKSISHI